MTPRVVTLGEVMLRLWVPAGIRLESAQTLNVTVAGAEANTAVALARASVPTAFLTRLPANPLGKKAATALAAQGVDVSGISWSEAGRIGTFYVELSVPPRPVSVVYDRAGSAASLMTPNDLDFGMIRDAEIVYVSGITPALSPTCREAAEAFMRTGREAGATVVFDVNYRSRLWSATQARAAFEELAKSADVLIVSEDDAREVFGVAGEIRRTLDAMAEITGVDSIAVTRGAAGAAWRHEGESGSVAPHAADVLDPIGAGDAFAGGVIMGLLDGNLRSGVERGSAMGAMQVGIYGDALIVEPDEIDSVIAGGSRDVSR